MHGGANRRRLVQRPAFPIQELGKFFSSLRLCGLLSSCCASSMRLFFSSVDQRGRNIYILGTLNFQASNRVLLAPRRKDTKSLPLPSHISRKHSWSSFIRPVVFFLAHSTNSRHNGGRLRHHRSRRIHCLGESRNIRSLQTWQKRYSRLACNSEFLLYPYHWKHISAERRRPKYSSYDSKQHRSVTSADRNNWNHPRSVNSPVTHPLTQASIRSTFLTNFAGEKLDTPSSAAVESGASCSTSMA